MKDAYHKTRAYLREHSSLPQAQVNELTDRLHEVDPDFFLCFAAYIDYCNRNGGSGSFDIIYDLIHLTSGNDYHPRLSRFHPDHKQEAV